MIVLEGVDKAGKSTLFDEILAQDAISPHKFGIPTGDPTFEYQEVLEKTRTPGLFDRFFYGEIPYSIAKKRTKYMDYTAFRCLQLMMQVYPHLVIYVRPQREIIMERLEKKPDSYISPGEANIVYDEFDEMFSQVFNTVVSHSGMLSISSIYPHIEKALNPAAWKYFNKWRDFKWGGTGALDPRFLFIGERYNPLAPHQVPFWSDAGRFLFECLDTIPIDMRLCHFTNAVSGFADVIPIELIKFLRPRAIICLGEVAWESTRKLPIPKDMKISKLPHPAYWKRFHHHSREHYCKALEKACTL